MKKLIVWTLIFCLSAAPALAQSRGSFTYGVAYDNAAEARLLALECLEISGFYNYRDIPRDALVRWTDHIYVQTKGSPTSEDREELRKFLMELGLRVPEMPGMEMTNEGDSRVNFTIYYLPQLQLPGVMPDFQATSLGASSVRVTEACEIAEGIIGIANDVTSQRQRNALMRRMLISSLGLRNFHGFYEDSVLYDPWTEAQTPSEVDWLMLNMLYSPSVRPGMTYDQVYDVMQNRFF